MNHSKVALCSLLAVLFCTALAGNDSILAKLPPTPTMQTSTVPANGDVNPYGIAIVPPDYHGGGKLKPGDILVSNFNASSNLQGTGSTIVKITKSGEMSVFFQGGTDVGLTTALGVLKDGYVLVGNMHTTDGTSATLQQGSIIVIDRFGHKVANWTDTSMLNGTWDLTVKDMGHIAQVFVSNVLEGTVVRLDLDMRHTVTIRNKVQIASGYMHRPDPAAFEVGPTGLALDANTDTLYVASTEDNAIYSIPNATSTMTDNGTGATVYTDSAHLRGPLGLVLAPNGNLITANGDAINPDPTQVSEMVEFTKGGVFVDQVSVNSTGPGGAFGVAIAGNDERVVLAAVDDIMNALDVWDVRLHGNGKPR